MDVGGPRNRAPVSEEVQYGEPLGRAPLLGTLKYMLGLLFEAEDIKNISLGAI
jgi:hypothetical protein